MNLGVFAGRLKFGFPGNRRGTTLSTYAGRVTIWHQRSVRGLRLRRASARVLVVAISVACLGLAGCGVRSPGATARSGVTGTVHLGPQCPVETVDDPCDDKPAAGVEVTVAEPVPGDSYTAGKVVASGMTDADGVFRIAVAPGEYVVTAKAGMSCELLDARVVADTFAAVDVPCDTGIR
jgi:hypothetical protein